MPGKGSRRMFVLCCPSMLRNARNWGPAMLDAYIYTATAALVAVPAALLFAAPARRAWRKLADGFCLLCVMLAALLHMERT